MRLAIAWVLLAVSVPGKPVAAFSPRTAEERAEALGDLSEVPAPLRAMLSPDDDFGLIRLPEPGDWLAEHRERGQTFAEFRRSWHWAPDEKRDVIYFQPLGKFTPGEGPALELLRRYAGAFFQMPVRLRPGRAAAATEFKARVNPQTKQVQWLTLELLKLLKTDMPADAFGVIGVTMQDLYPSPSWNYVFGQASFTERVGVYSFARYDPAFFDEERPANWRATMLRRSCKVLTHELGHMFGLEHCIYYDCVMNGSNHLAEADAQPVHLCPVCLRKLQLSVRFDAVARYRELAKFYAEQGWTDDARWCEGQAEKGAAAAKALGWPE